MFLAVSRVKDKWLVWILLNLEGAQLHTFEKAVLITHYNVVYLTVSLEFLVFFSPPFYFLSDDGADTIFNE